jgi:predicted  nucleic acid-binding Zn-ribbon protein
MTNNVQELQERIEFLEKELIAAGLRVDSAQRDLVDSVRDEIELRDLNMRLHKKNTALELKMLEFQNEINKCLKTLVAGNVNHG